MHTTTTTERSGQGFNVLAFMDAYEHPKRRRLTRAEIVAGFQGLLDMGIAWSSLPAYYTRDAAFLLQTGAIRPKSTKIN